MFDTRSARAQVVRFGTFELDLRAAELRKAGIRIALQDQPFRVMEQLLKRPGEVVTRKELRRELWPDNTFIDFEHGLNAAIKRLRDALGDSAERPRFVETVPRRGYRFIAPVETRQEQSASPAAERVDEPSLRIGLPSLPVPPTAPGSSDHGSAIAAASAPRRRVWTGLPKGVLLGGALTLIMGLVVGWRGDHPWHSGSRLSSPEPDSNRVAVAVFENQTSDPSLDPLGRLAADRIIRLVAQVSNAEVIPRAVDPVSADGMTADAMALASGASLLVTGAYYLHEGGLEFHARILEAAGGRLLHAVDPVSGRRADPAEALRRLAQTTAGAVAMHFDDYLGGLHIVSYPPTLDGYREYRAGLEVYQSDYPRALAHFERALEIDPKFWLPQFIMAGVYVNRREYERIAPLLARLEADADRLTPAERLLIEYRRASAEGRWAHSRRLMEELEPLVPGSLAVNYNIMLMSLNQNRPRTAIAANDRMASGRQSYRHGIGTFRLHVLTLALHVLGEHHRELEEARLAQQYAPDVLGFVAAEARALATLGQHGELDQLIDQTLAIPAAAGAPGIVVGTVGLVMQDTARELRAHGHRQASLALADRAVEWYRARPPDAAGHVSHRYELARALYLAERWEEADALFSVLAAERPDDVRVQGYVGVVAARRGDADRARGVSAELRRAAACPYGGHTYFRARIAALLGEQQRAVDLLRDAFGEGFPAVFFVYGHNFHHTPDFEPLLDYAPFLELVQPRG